MNHWSTYEQRATDHRADLLRDARGGGHDRARWQADSIDGSAAAAPANRIRQAAARLRLLAPHAHLDRARAFMRAHVTRGAA
jgi:hypothetical protein